ncbi:MAG: sigma 54-interacting transcriptional regulator, partial [Gemmatimonadota bacterium]
GAFTDAKTDRMGRFELADGGTLFLDEIANIALTQQSKLLRVLQTGDLERVGSSKTRHVDVRVISATNADLRSEVASGRFREDLLYRLNTIEIRLPPLRDRREDIPPLAAYFLLRYAERYRKPITGFEPAAMTALLENAWPGNVRELDHAIERAVLLTEGHEVSATDLSLAPVPDGAGRLDRLTLEDAERLLIQKALERAGGNVSEAAKALGVSRSALYRRLERFGL